MTLDLQRPAPGPRVTPLQPVMGSRLERLLLTVVRGLILGLLLLSLLTALGGAGVAGWAYLQSRPAPANAEPPAVAPRSTEPFKAKILSSKGPASTSGQAAGEDPSNPVPEETPWTDAQLDALITRLDALLARMDLPLHINRRHFMARLKQHEQSLDPSLRTRFLQELDESSHQLLGDQSFHEQVRRKLSEDERRGVVDKLLHHVAEHVRQQADRQEAQMARQNLERAQMHEVGMLASGLVAGAVFLAVSLGLGLLLMRCERALHILIKSI